MDKHILYPLLRTGAAEKHRNAVPGDNVLLIRYDHPEQEAVVFRSLHEYDLYDVEDALLEIFPSLQPMNLNILGFCKITGSDRALFHLLPKLETP